MPSNPLPKHDKIVVGRFGSAYGIQGWIKVISLTDPIENILQYSPWQIQHQGQWQIINCEASKSHGKVIVVKLAGCVDRELARSYTNDLLAINRDQLPALYADEYYWSDLVGLTVKTIDGTELGRVEKLLETGANDVIVIQGERQRLLPYTKDVVQSVDLKNGVMIVDWDAEFE